MSYSGNPSSSQLDAIRFWLQDTGTVELLNDDEIRYYLDYAVNYTDDALLIAAGLCTALMAKYAGEVQIAGDGITYSGEQLQDKYAALAKQLKAQWQQLNGASGVPFAGGISWWSDCFDRKPPIFAIGGNDNPFAGSQLYPNRSRNLEYDYYDPDPAEFQGNT